MALALFVIPLAAVAYQENEVHLVELTERRAATVALIASGTDELDRLQQTVLELALRPGERVAVLNDEGDPVADTGSGLVALPQGIRSDALAGAISGGVWSDQGRVVAAAPVVRDQAVDGLAVVTVPVAGALARSRILLIVLGLSALGLVLVAAYAARAVARSVVRPVERLDQAAAQLAGGDLTVRASTADGPPEIQRLAATLNDTARRLQDLVTAQRAFIADVSHQLRTPLTGLRLRVESLEASSPDADDVRALSRELDRLIQIVERLLDLARAEQQHPEPVPVDVAAIVADRVAAWRTMARHKGVRLLADAPPALPAALAVEGALEQILDNYLSNAVRAAPEGSTVELLADYDDDHVVCCVADRGPGLGPEERRRAFERFWSPRDAPGGTGLGLAIVRELAASSGAAAELRPRDAGGLVAVLTMRRAAASEGRPAAD